jgi:hypothetical protein
MIKIKEDLDRHLDRLNQLRREFPPAAYAVISGRAQAMDYELLGSWPKRGDPRHPYATGRSALGLRVKRSRRGMTITNREDYWHFVGKTAKRRHTGLAFRVIPGALDGWSDEIEEDMTGALVEAMTPGRR